VIRAAMLLAAAALTLTAAPSRAAESPEELLRGAWYEIEFFVFERSAVLDAGVREVLTQPEALPYPHAMGIYRTPGEPFGAAYELDAATRACLTFPTLSYSVTPDAEAATSDLAAELVGEALPPPSISPALAPNPQLELLNAIAEFERSLEAERGEWLPAETFALTREAQLVERRRVGRVLFHGRWRQAVPARDAGEPILLQAGERLPGGHELAGTVNVTLGRYLHFEARLNYAAPLLGAQPQELALRADGTPLALPQAALPGGFMRLAESRRMRSEELHYLDHPKLGVVVRIDPVAVPEEIVGLFEALQEGVE
jgi:hypothetical protein